MKNEKSLKEMQNAFLNLEVSQEEQKNLNGGLSYGSAVPIGGTIVYHGCNGWSVDCWCEPHCVGGKSCTTGWY